RRMTRSDWPDVSPGARGAPDGAPAFGGRNAPTQRPPILSRHPGCQRPGGRSPALRLRLRSGDIPGPDVGGERVVAHRAHGFFAQRSLPMTFSLHAFNSADTAFDVMAAGLEDARPHPTEAALAQLGHAMMTELLD